METTDFMMLICILCAVICVLATTINVIVYWLFHRELGKAIKAMNEKGESE